MRHGSSTERPSHGTVRSARPTSSDSGKSVPPEGPILALRVEDLLEKEAVLADSSEAVFTIPHFEGFAAVLVQLTAVDVDELQELVTGAWAACAPQELVERYLGGR